MRPNIDDHDYDVKMRKVFEFLEEGDKVKVTMRFRGREMAHGELGMAVLRRVQEQTRTWPRSKRTREWKAARC
jgi:translation initiation factor IF-3